MKRRTTKALHPRKKQRVEGKSSKRSPCFILFCLPDYILGDIGKYLFSFFVKMKKQKKNYSFSTIILPKKISCCNGGKICKNEIWWRALSQLWWLDIHNYFRCSAIKGKKWDQQHLCLLSFLFQFCFDRFFYPLSTAEKYFFTT